ncbi:MAG: NAD(P)-binding domain-containing protein [Alphaproteobacteria bacterium]|nr:NAD(P)-binding domain-containing protein [Alphaproteobacteria bacterium]
MDIAIIGAGRVGSTLGRGLAAAGHRIHYVRRDVDSPVPERLDHDGATTGTAEAVVARSGVVLLATPWAAAEAAVSGLDFGGRPLLDATNPIGAGMALTHGHTDSGAEQVQRWAPTAKVVKVFNTTGMENMAEPRYPAGASMMLACGDDAEAVATAVSLATDLGFDAHPFGALASARLLEPFALVWIRLALVHGHGRDFAFGMLRR